jgi:hypothetical protein
MLTELIFTHPRLARWVAARLHCTAALEVFTTDTDWI